ncbi:MAG TPA: FimV/HubP family polar landmark protein [Steroidobacteraceae bacterium]|jgi:pilus assembly protein FimV|nr:FimV/HubP family polar landmark protein [Steroidobacteraceae bacterium]
MSSGKNPLVWMMALSMPGAAQALGLGDIHVDSALNERLAAEIEIVGATPLELAELKAAVANRETFLHYGAERPAFLASTSFRVAQDVHGRPVLAVRSTETFTEPVVNFLVDLNWRNGQLIRQYTLLLDPAGFAPASAATAASPVAAPQTLTAPTLAAAPPMTEAAPAVLAAPTLATAPTMEAAPTVAAAPTAQPNPTSPQRTARKTAHLKVGAKATLRGIAWRVGERSESDIERTMIAIFRANPAAFDGNINRLHRGATLTIPSRAEAALIPLTDARREIQAQMAAWHSPAHALAANNAAPALVVPSAAAAPAAATDAPAPNKSVQGTSTPSAAMPSADAHAEVAAAALDHRIESLEQALSRMQGLMQSERDQLVALQRQTARAAVASPATVAAPAAVTLPTAVADPRTQLKSLFLALISIVASFAVVGAVLTTAYFRFRRRLSMDRDSRLVTEAERAEAPVAAEAVPTEAAPEDTQAPAPDGTHPDVQIQATDIEATHPALPMLRIESAGRSEVSTTPLPGDSLDDTVVIAPHDTVNQMVDTVNLRMNETHLDYNFLDLEQTAQHVQMPSVLNQHAVVKERRTNLADVLKMAIEREPDRHDLRMKLIELYYSAAATNRKAFLDVVQKLARERDHMQPEQWDKIAFMGRQIAAENPLFAEQADDEDLADCA